MKSICNIRFGYQNVTGFICFIPLSNGKKIPTLISSRIPIYENLQNINLTFDDGKISINLEINKNRIIYFCDEDKDNIVIIEIKDSDIDDKGNSLAKSNFFLEIDENIFQKNYENYSNKNAYMLKYIEKIPIISIGKVLKIDENGRIIHFIISGPGSQGSPILNSETLKVFGIHLGFKTYGFGKMIYYAVNNFINFVYQNSSNY